MVRRVQAVAMRMTSERLDNRANIICSMLCLYETHLYTEDELQHYLEAIQKTGGTYCQGKKRGDGFTKFYFGNDEYYLHPRDAFIANIYLVFHNLNTEVICFILL